LDETALLRTPNRIENPPDKRRKAMPPKPTLNKDDILKAEFGYIAETVFQANEDRSRVTSFYIVTVGSFAAAIFGLPSDLHASNMSLAFFILFLVLTFMGTLTLSQLARLRAAWHESVEAMNQIKDFYIKHNKDIESAFKWRRRTIPPTNKRFSIANLIATEVTMLSSLTAGAASYFLLSYFHVITPTIWLIIGGIALVSIIVHWQWYKRLLVDDR
jgi:hypothetical protein